MKNRKTNYLKLGILFIGISLLLWNCNEENFIQQKSFIQTVEIQEALNLFELNEFKKNYESKSNQYFTFYTNKIHQEKIKNSNELLTIIPVSAANSEFYNRLLLLKIDNNIQSVIFKMYPSENKITEKFSGEIIITDLEDVFLKGFRVTNGIYTAQLKRQDTHGKNILISKSSSGNVCPDHGECKEGSNCIVCTQELEEIVITSNSSSNYTPIYYLFDFTGTEFSEGANNGPTTNMGWDSEASNNFNSEKCTGGKIKSVMGACYCPEGKVEDDNGNCIDKPCNGDPIKNPEIVSSGSSGKKGGTFGCTRSNPNKTCGGVKGKKNHDGIDIKADVNTPTFSMYKGKVSSLRNTFSEGEYKKNSYGNYIIIKSTVNGNTIYIRYNHLNKVSVKKDQDISVGQIIGLNGNTGNAAAKGVTPHIHIQILDSSWKSINPADYLKTKFNSEYNPISNNCN